MIAQTYRSTKEEKAHLQRKRTVETGFPSPATDHLEERLNINEHIVNRPASTFYSRVRGHDYEEFGIYDGDILVIDRSLAPRHNSIVMMAMDGEFKICRVQEIKGDWFVRTATNKKIPIHFENERETAIWGRVTHIIHSCI